MDGFTAVPPVKFFIIIIINTYHSFARARERKRKLLPVVSLFLSVFSRTLLVELQTEKKSTARAFIFRKSERDTHSFSRYTHTHRKA